MRFLRRGQSLYRCHNGLYSYRMDIGCCSTASTSHRPDKGARPSVYDSTYVESGWYDWWERNGQFKYTNQDGKRPFSICLPPPNVTGDLHIGHALTVAIQDVLLRWHRMKGESVVWIPGYDHAGIATQVVVEKQMMREKGLRRVDVAREEFVKECFKWKEKKMVNIQTQLKRLGASLDWSRTYYTMDEKFSTGVTEAFLRLHRRGHIFRNEKLVNWCPFLKSTLSDIEVDRTVFNCDDTDSRLHLPGRSEPVIIGRLFFVKYPLVTGDGSLSVATTRPETIPADVALAVHPDDQRYAKYIGQVVKNPLLPNGNSIPVLADSQVDPEYGTGVLKVTPAHDWTDYEIGERHGLPLTLRCLTEEGKLNDQCGPDLHGLDRFDARDKIVDILTSRGLLVEIKNQSQVVLPLCSRTGDVVEPMLKQQWFMNCRSMAAAAIKAVEEGRLKITPSWHEAKWRHWLNQTGDWCISRQLWWGHRIPAYRLRGTDDWYCGKDVNEALDSAKRAHPEISSNDLQQDDDVLDTWFSSALVPLIASGWPKETTSNSTLNPLSLMETGHDILLFWVTRMVMVGLELNNRLPFDEILLHGIVFDKNGRKMSKSLGNVIDPLDIIDGVELETLKTRLDASSLSPAEIEVAKEGMGKEFPQGVLKCGADALRFTLMIHDPTSEKLNLDVNLMLNGRKFCNKLWQAFTFVENSWKTCAEAGWKPNGYADRIKTDCQMLPDVERWLLSRLSKTISKVDSFLSKYEFTHATKALYNFIWFEFCDLYLEWSKFFLRSVQEGGVAIEDGEARKRQVGDCLYLVADSYIRLLAPFMPFLTEELHGRLMEIRRAYGGMESGESIHNGRFPMASEFPYVDDGLEKQMAVVLRAFDAVRSIRREFGLSAKEPLACVIFGDEHSQKAVKKFNEFFTLLGKAQLKSYRSIDDSMADFESGHIWKSVDATLLVGIELKKADHQSVAEKLSAQIRRLEKRKREFKTNHDRAQRILSGEMARRHDPAELEVKVVNLEQKIADVDVELDRLQKMHANFSKS